MTLCEDAGGVDGFVIGSEMVALDKLRDGGGVILRYLFGSRLQQRRRAASDRTASSLTRRTGSSIDMTIVAVATSTFRLTRFGPILTSMSSGSTRIFRLLMSPVRSTTKTRSKSVGVRPADWARARDRPIR